jgi:16S rRNA (cytidine1402-2'-O)-methyltransferase
MWQGINQELKNGLYIISTPIGNLSDITLRALYVLDKCDIILCEDTRQTAKLLSFYKISNKKLLVFNEHKSGVSKETVLQEAQNGTIGLVSDAGTPLISDPGIALVSYLRANQAEVFTVPGASSLVSALSICGLDYKNFIFLGFYDKSARVEIEKLKDFEGAICFFENTTSLSRTLQEIYEILGVQKFAICREMTKKFEEVILGELPGENLPNKGEIAIIIQNKPHSKPLSEQLSEILQGNHFLESLSVRDKLEFINNYHPQIYKSIGKSALYDFFNGNKLALD